VLESSSELDVKAAERCVDLDPDEFVDREEPAREEVEGGRERRTPRRKTRGENEWERTGSRAFVEGRTDSMRLLFYRIRSMSRTKEVTNTFNIR